jgi:hypothetical protein
MIPGPLDKQGGSLYFTRRKTDHALPLRPDVAPMRHRNQSIGEIVPWKKLPVKSNSKTAS